MDMQIKKEYSNGELTVVWKPRLCIHSEVCVKSLPEVYRPDEKPWIQPENASTNELKSQIDKCPSGALTYFMNDGSEKQENGHVTEVEVTDGPLMIYGAVKIKKADGSIESRDKATALCRCGASDNKPYCDGTHKKIDFKG